MEKVSFKPSENFKEITEKVFEEQKSRILKSIPQALVEHIAGTAIPNLLTKGDLDVNVRVQKEYFEDASSALKSMYEVNQPNNWTKAYASFKDNGLPIDFGVQLTIIDSVDDHFVKHRDRLLSNPDLVKKLNGLKEKYEGRSMDEYRKAKGEFFENL